MHKIRALLLPALLILLTLTSCQTSGMIQASNVEQTLVPVLDRHEALLTGQLDPATISAEDKISFRRSGYLLRVALDQALGKTPPPPPAGLVVNPTQPIPPRQ
jgi:hypothetical protein